MDPLSIVASVLALVTAAGKTSEGLQRAWELRRIDEDFTGLVNVITGLRTQLQAVKISLEQFSYDGHSETINDCYHNVQKLCDQAKKILVEIDKLVELLTHKRSRPIQQRPVDFAQLCRKRWLRRKPALLRLTSNLSPIVHSLTATANILRDIASDSRNVASFSIERVELMSAANTHINRESSTPESQFENWLHQAIELEDTSMKITQLTSEPTKEISRKSSTESFHSALSSSSVSTSSFIAIAGSLTPKACKRFCPCQCHVTTSFRTPSWLKHVVGSMSVHGNYSINLGRRPCNKACQGSGPTSLQILYLAPSWIYLRSLNFYFKLQSLYCNKFVLETPRIIPSNASIWSIIELGKLSKLQEMLHQRLVSLHDVTSSGRSLLNYAAVKGQLDIYKFLVESGADPFFRDRYGIASNQPGVDRALTGTELDRNVSKSAQASSYDLFINSETLDQQQFDVLHLVVLGIRPIALDKVLKKYIGPRSDINVQDVNARTPLTWAAWRGNVRSVELLISSNADLDRVDSEGFTAMARAAKAGHLDCVRALIRAGASIHIADGNGYQPLHHASGNKSNGLPIVDELLLHGASVHSVCRRGTPLQLAANRGSRATVRRLIQAGSDIDAQDSDGDTPAMTALLCWNESAFTALMYAGAKLNIVRKSGQNILHLLTWTGSSSLWNTIVERAKYDQLADVDPRLLHNGHSLNHCFEHCRDLWFAGTRESNEIEEQRFNRMLDAFSRE